MFGLDVAAHVAARGEGAERAAEDVCLSAWGGGGGRGKELVGQHAGRVVGQLEVRVGDPHVDRVVVLVLLAQPGIGRRQLYQCWPLHPSLSLSHRPPQMMKYARGGCHH